MTLVSVITPTWLRHDPLLRRCIPSVTAQDYPAVEHVVVSDGPDPELRVLLAAAEGVAVYVELDVHDPERHWGAAARRVGIAASTGSLITYVDDDDALRPDHVSLLAAALEANPDAGFAVSRMVSHHPSGPVTFGYGELQYGQVGTPMLMHRRELLDVAGWGAPSACEDWDMVACWIAAGTPHVRVDADTSDVYPSTYGANL